MEASPDVTFSDAEYLSEFNIPLVVVYCRIRGKDELEGLRLDLDKMAFIDHLDNEAIDTAINSAAEELVLRLTSEIYRGPN
jgi:hypothetical protein